MIHLKDVGWERTNIAKESSFIGGNIRGRISPKGPVERRSMQYSI